MLDVLIWNKYARVVTKLSERLGVSQLEALGLFFYCRLFSFLFVLYSVNLDAIRIHTAAIVLGFLPAITSFLHIKSEISTATSFTFTGSSILLQYEPTNPATF